MEHAGRIAGGVAGDVGVTIDQRDAPAARREARGDRAAGEPGADHDGVPVRCCDGEWWFVPPHAPARREAGGEGRFCFLRRLIANKTGSFKRAPQHRMTVGDDRRVFTRDARKRLADRTRIVGGIDAKIERVGAQPELLQHVRDIADGQRQHDASRLEFQPMYARHAHGPCVGKKRRKRAGLCGRHAIERTRRPRRHEMQTLATRGIGAPCGPCFEEGAGIAEMRIDDHEIAPPAPGAGQVMQGEERMGHSMDAMRFSEPRR